MPPLRERGDDIDLIAHHFLEEMNASSGVRKTFAPGALARIRQHPWLGNVRELRNHIQRMFIMAGDEGLDGPDPESAEAPAIAMAGRLRAGPAITVALGTPLSVAARELILSTLEHCGGERKRTAEMLGICTKTLYNRLREYGINEAQKRAGVSDATRAS